MRDRCFVRPVSLLDCDHFSAERGILPEILAGARPRPRPWSASGEHERHGVRTIPLVKTPCTRSADGPGVARSKARGLHGQRHGGAQHDRQPSPRTKSLGECADPMRRLPAGHLELRSSVRITEASGGPRPMETESNRCDRPAPAAGFVIDVYPFSYTIDRQREAGRACGCVPGGTIPTPGFGLGDRRGVPYDLGLT
jgi:hypothetical protein